MRQPARLVFLGVLGVLCLALGVAGAQEPNPVDAAPVGVPEEAVGEEEGGAEEAAPAEEAPTEAAATPEATAGEAAPGAAPGTGEEEAAEEDGAHEVRDTGSDRDTAALPAPTTGRPPGSEGHLDVLDGVPDSLTVPPEAEVSEVPGEQADAEHPVTPVVVAPVPPEPSVLDAISHSMRSPHGVLQSLRLGLLALVFLLLSLVLERQRRRLAPEGLLPGVLASLAVISRGAFVPLVLLSLFALTPTSWGWVEPLVVVVIAIAAGWASREILGDVFAGMVLTVERPFREGQRVRIGEVEGEVTRQGLRLTWLRTDDGRVVAVPNRSVTALGWSIEPDAFAPIRVRLYVDPDLPARAVREVLEEATLASPWLATQHTPVVYRAPEELHLWIIEGRLVHPRYAGAFKGSLVELSEGRLAELAAAREEDAGAAARR